MIMLPIETPNHAQDALVIVLGKDGLARMKEADPAEVVLSKCGKKLVNPTILLCYEDESPEFNRIIQGGDVKKIIAFLQRGWKFRPERGDHDRGPESIHKGN